MSVGARCFQCKEELRGSGTGQRHATLTGHTWQPGYYCTSCEAMFLKHIECEQHIHQFGGRCKRAPTKSSSTSIYRTSSLNISGRSPAVAAPRPSLSPSSVSEPQSKYGFSPLLQCTMCQPPVAFLSQESLNNHSRGMSSCAKCPIHFHSHAELLDHYRISPSSVHPKCSDCGVGVLGDAEWKAHKTRCARAAAPALIPDLGAESTQSKVTPRPCPDEGLVTVVSVPSTGESGRDVTDMAAILLGPSGLGSNFSSLEPSPTVTVTHDVDDTEIDVPASTRSYEPSLARHLEDSDVGVSHVNVAFPRVNMREDEELSDDEVLTPTMTAATLEGAQRTGAESLSLHCRLCLMDPCVKPVATLCGHIFCHSCIVRQLAITMCCPVCQRPSLIRLHMGGEY